MATSGRILARSGLATKCRVQKRRNARNYAHLFAKSLTTCFFSCKIRFSFMWFNPPGLNHRLAARQSFHKVAITSRLKAKRKTFATPRESTQGASKATSPNEAPVRVFVFFIAVRGVAIVQPKRFRTRSIESDSNSQSKQGINPVFPKRTRGDSIFVSIEVGNLGAMHPRTKGTCVDTHLGRNRKPLWHTHRPEHLRVEIHWQPSSPALRVGSVERALNKG